MTDHLPGGQPRAAGIPAARTKTIVLAAAPRCHVRTLSRIAAALGEHTAALTPPALSLVPPAPPAIPGVAHAKQVFRSYSFEVCLSQMIRMSHPGRRGIR
jgi:hypothetical protein